MKLHIPRSSMHIYENGTSISKKNSGHPLQSNTVDFTNSLPSQKGK